MAPIPEYPDVVRPSRAKKVIKAVVGWVIGLALLLGALWLVDAGVRDFVETRAESEVLDRLPAGAQDVQVTIGGFSILQQMLAGRVDTVDLELSLDSAALTKLATGSGFAGQFLVAGSAVGIDSQIEVLGVPIPFAVTVDPTLDGDYLLLTATGVSAAGSPELDLTQFVDLTTFSTRVCVASTLPETIRLTKVTASGDLLRLVAVGTDVPTDLDALMTRGSCEEPAADAEAPAEEGVTVAP